MNVLQIEEKSEMQIYKDMGDLLSAYLLQNGFILKASGNYQITSKDGILGLSDSAGDLKNIYLENIPPRLRISAENINDLVWQIRQWGQPTTQAPKSNSILMNFLGGRRYGWVSTSYNWHGKYGTAEISWRRDLDFTFTFFKSRAALGNGAGLEYFSAADMARRIYAWLQSDFGISACRDKGYWMYPFGEILNPAIIMGNEQFDRTPNFTAKFAVLERHIFDVSENFVEFETMAEEFRIRKGIELIAV